MSHSTKRFYEIGPRLKNILPYVQGGVGVDELAKAGYNVNSQVDSGWSHSYRVWA